MKLMEAESKVIKPNPHSIGMRTSVPREIVKALKLEDKDKINWIIESENDKLKVRVEKL